MIQVLVILLIFTLFFISLFISHKRSQKIKICTLVITAQNKDKQITFNEYKKEINNFFNCLLYKKEINNGVINFKPQTVHNMFLGKNLEVKNDTFFIEIKGPYNVVKILARSLDTPGSSLEKSII